MRQPRTLCRTILAVLALLIVISTRGLAITAPHMITSVNQTQHTVHIYFTLDTTTTALPSKVVLMRANGFTTSSSAFSPVDSITSVTSRVGYFNVTGLTAGNHYTFYIVAYYSSGSLQSNYDTLTAPGSSSTTISPPHITAYANQTQRFVHIYFTLDTATTALPSKIVLMRANEFTTTGTFSPVDSITSVTSRTGYFNATGLTPGNHYTFYIVAYYSDSARHSNYDTVTAPASSTRPISAPHITAAVNQTEHRVHIYFTLDTTTTALPSKVVLMRADGFTTSSSAFSPVDSISPITSHVGYFNVTGLTPGNHYTFYIIAYYSDSARQSNYDTLTAPAITIRNPYIQAVRVGGDSIRITYYLDTAVSKPTALILFESTGGGSFSPVDTLTPVSSYNGSLLRSGLSPGTYTYYLVAIYSDSARQSNQRTVTITGGITFTSQPPPTDAYAVINTAFTYDADAVDANNGIVHYSVAATGTNASTITNLSIDSLTGVLTFTPTVAGRAYVVITAYLASNPQVHATMAVQVLVHTCPSNMQPRFRGRVLDGNGNPAPGGSVWVNIVRIDSATGVTISTTKATVSSSGYYYLNASDGGSYQLMVDGTNYSSYWYPSAYLQRDGDVINATCNDTIVRNFTVTLRSDSGMATLRGTTSAQSSGVGVTARITFVGFENGVPDSVRWERRLSAGPIYSLHDSVTGTNHYQISLRRGYTWIAYAQPYTGQGSLDTLAPQYYSGVGNAAAATDITLPNPIDTADFVFATKTGYSDTVRGVVKDYNNTGLRAYVVAFPMSNHGIVDKTARTAATDTSTGAFTLTGLVPGDYVLWALPFSYTYAPGYMKSNDFAALSWHNATTITVNASSSLTGNDIKLRRSNGADGTARLRGVARGTPGSNIKRSNSIASEPPVVGAVVFVLNDKDEVITYALTGNDGSFTLDGIGPTAHTLIIDKIGFEQYRLDITSKPDELTDMGSLDLQGQGASSVPDEPTTLIAHAEVYPNPTGSTMTIRFLATSGSTELQLIDAAGSTVRTQQVSTTSGINTVTFDSEGLSSGRYLIVLKNGASLATLPVTIMH